MEGGRRGSWSVGSSFQDTNKPSLQALKRLPASSSHRYPLPRTVLPCQRVYSLSRQPYPMASGHTIHYYSSTEDITVGPYQPWSFFGGIRYGPLCKTAVQARSLSNSAFCTPLKMMFLKVLPRESLFSACIASLSFTKGAIH